MNKEIKKKKQTNLYWSLSPTSHLEQFHRNITFIVQSRLEESSRRKGNRHRIALETTELSPEASEVLQQVHDPLLLALTELLVLPIPDVLCILCRRESSRNTGCECYTRQ